jgi:hypothetical protein
MKTERTLNYVSGPDPCFTAREIGEEDLFSLTLLAGETEIPLSRRKSAHPESKPQLGILNGDEGRGEIRDLFISDNPVPVKI